MKYQEIETKYNAENISLAAFKGYCEFMPAKHLCVSGYDHFYDTSQDAQSFYRHRVGPGINQLTFKRKHTEKNNFIRTEHNIDLLPEMSREQVAALCAEHDYAYNTSIFKTAFIYTFERYSLSYYVCYDKEMKEVGRFIEIEASETYPWASETDAWNELLVQEASMKPLGLTVQARIKRSLFEMFRRQK